MVVPGERRDYIEAIALPPMPRDAPRIGEVARWPPGDSAQIDAGALVAFDRSLSRQNGDDVSNSLLFAQLAANAASDRFAQPGKWTSTYSKVLETVGWSIQRAGDRSPVRVDPPVDWSELVALAFSGSSGASLAATAMKAADRLATGSRPLSIWQDNAAPPVQGNFVVQTCQVSNGDLLSESAQLIYTLIREPDGFLNWATHYEISTSTTVMALNEDVYAQVRQQITEKLGDRPKSYVAAVAL